LGGGAKNLQGGKKRGGRPRKQKLGVAEDRIKLPKWGDIRWDPQGDGTTKCFWKKKKKKENGKKKPTGAFAKSLENTFAGGAHCGDKGEKALTVHNQKHCKKGRLP